MKPGLPLALALCLAAQPVAAEQFRLGLITPPSHQWTITAGEIAEEIAARTGGEVEILVMPSGQLGSEARMLQQLQSGALDFGMLTVGEFANRSSDYGVFLAPFLAEDAASARRLLGGAVAGQLLRGFEDFGLHGLSWGMAGMRQIVLAAPVEEVGGLAGLKIRTVPLAPELDFWRGIGAAPTPMPLPELYSAFANGAVDGMQIDYEGAWNAGYHEHAGQILASGHMMFPMAAVASGRSWAELEETQREVIEEVFAARIDEMVGRYGEIDDRYLAELETTGVPILRVGRDWFEPAVSEWYEAWHRKTGLLAELEAEAGE